MFSNSSSSLNTRQIYHFAKRKAVTETSAPLLHLNPSPFKTIIQEEKRPSEAWEKTEKSLHRVLEKQRDSDHVYNSEWLYHRRYG